MYSERDLQKDLYSISSSHFVKYKLLESFWHQRIDKEEFITELRVKKTENEIESILNILREMDKKVQNNGGKIDKDPIKEAQRLKEQGNLTGAFKILRAVLRSDFDNDEALVAFGWLMYSYLKQSELDIDRYTSNLRILNDIADIDPEYSKIPEVSRGSTSFASTDVREFISDSIRLKKQKRKITENILWSIYRVLKSEKSNADRLSTEFFRFSRNSARFIETRWSDDGVSASRSIVRIMMNNLSPSNYFILMDNIGFKWFDIVDTTIDTKVQTNINQSDFNCFADPIQFEEKKESASKDRPLRPFKEFVLNHYSKKLINSELHFATHNRINKFIDILKESIVSNPSYEYLPYYQGKLLLIVGRKDEALDCVTAFGRSKSNEFWVWNLLSELVEGEDKFNCLCAGLLCKTDPKMIVKLQEKIIPILIQRKMFSQAKRELDTLIHIKQSKQKSVSPKLLNWKNEDWYKQADNNSTRDQLDEYAKKAQSILYKSLPVIDIFITFVNEEKNTVNFLMLLKNKRLKPGYLRISNTPLTREWKNNEILKAKVFSHKNKPELYSVFEVTQGDEECLPYFMQSDIGNVEKREDKPFAFVNDVFISPHLVVKHDLKDSYTIEYIKKIKFNKSKNDWTWYVDKITGIEKNE